MHASADASLASGSTRGAPGAGDPRPISNPAFAPTGGLFRALLARIPASVRTSLDIEQMTALRVAAEELTGDGHALDIRLNLPLVRRRYYLVLVGGKDRRSPTGPAHRRAVVRTGNRLSKSVALAGALLLGGLLASAILGHVAI